MSPPRAATLAEKDPAEGITSVHFPEKKTLLETITAGEGSSNTVLNWILYRYLREDIAD